MSERFYVDLSVTVLADTMHEADRLAGELKRIVLTNTTRAVVDAVMVKDLRPDRPKRLSNA